MKICKDNEWAFVVTLKDDSLKNLQEEIKDVENRHKHNIAIFNRTNKGKTGIEQKYEWISESLSPAEHIVYWVSCTETITGQQNNTPVTTRFVFLSSTEVDKDNVRNITQAGRRRWKIENEGFNMQKNGGYNLEHKYSRSTFCCYKNYYQCLQIAHMINQLAEQSNHIADMFEAHKKFTLKHIWKDLISVLKIGVIEEKDFVINARIQVRLAG